MVEEIFDNEVAEEFIDDEVEEESIDEDVVEEIIVDEFAAEIIYDEFVEEIIDKEIRNSIFVEEIMIPNNPNSDPGVDHLQDPGYEENAEATDQERQGMRQRRQGTVFMFPGTTANHCQVWVLVLTLLSMILNLMLLMKV